MPERIGDLVAAGTLVLATERDGRTRRFGRPSDGVRA
jgi:hypothetical protein